MTWALGESGHKMEGGGWAAVQTWVRNAEQGTNDLQIVSADEARPGDIVAYDWGGQDDFGSDGHIGFLASNVEGGKFTALEGNYQDAVLPRPARGRQRRGEHEVHPRRRWRSGARGARRRRRPRCGPRRPGSGRQGRRRAGRRGPGRGRRGRAGGRLARRTGRAGRARCGSDCRAGRSRSRSQAAAEAQAAAARDAAEARRSETQEFMAVEAKEAARKRARPCSS